MTNKTKVWIITTVIALVSLFSFGQPNNSTIMQKLPAWVSDKGYWVIESNVATPHDHVVRFYNEGNLLVYKETLTGVRLNPEKRKIKMKLKRILESSVLAWENGRQPHEELALIKAVL